MTLLVGLLPSELNVKEAKPPPSKRWMAALLCQSLFTGSTGSLMSARAFARAVHILAQAVSHCGNAAHERAD